LEVLIDRPKFRFVAGLQSHGLINRRLFFHPQILPGCVKQGLLVVRRADRLCPEVCGSGIHPAHKNHSRLNLKILEVIVVPTEQKTRSLLPSASAHQHSSQTTEGRNRAQISDSFGRGIGINTCNTDATMSR
jgi:hypothetical protein